MLGRLRLQVLDGQGNLVQDTGFIDNLITNAGKAAMAGLFGNTGAITAFTYLALGTSATAVAATDTTLTAEITDTGLARTSATVSRVTTSVTNDTTRFTYTWTASGNKTVNEAGIFNASSSGIMASHLLTGTLALQNTYQLVATYDIQFS